MDGGDANEGYVPIESLQVYRDLEDLSDEVWACVRRWAPFDRDTVGIQLVTALDSAGSNLTEGDSRYSNKESLHFFFIARASGREALFWLRRSLRRSLMPETDAVGYIGRLTSVLRRVSALIETRRRRLDRVREWAEGYTAPPCQEADEDPAGDMPNEHPTP